MNFVFFSIKTKKERNLHTHTSVNWSYFLFRARSLLFSLESLTEEVLVWLIRCGEPLALRRFRLILTRSSPKTSPALNADIKSSNSPLSPLTCRPLVWPFWPFWPFCPFCPLPMVNPFDTRLSIASLLVLRSIVRLRS